MESIIGTLFPETPSSFIYHYACIYLKKNDDRVMPLTFLRPDLISRDGAIALYDMIEILLHCMTK